MRAMPTRHEQILQVLLQSMGCAREFKQQVEIFGYIADFEHCGVRNGKLACVPFIIEVDGNSHNTRKGRAWDATRDRAFNKNGYSVLRVTNASLERNPRGAIAAVKEMLDSEHGKSKPTVRRFTG